MEKLGRIGARCDNSQDGEKNIFDSIMILRWRRSRGCEKIMERRSPFSEKVGETVVGVAVIAQVRMGRSSAPQLRARPLQIKS